MKNRLTSSAFAAAAVGLLLCSSMFLAARSPQQSPAAASKAAPAASTFVVPDLDQRVAKFKVVRMAFHSKGLSAREIKMIDKLVDASGLADCIYWRQSDPEGLKLYLSLAHANSAHDELLRRYLRINGSRFDLIDNEKTFAGANPMPPGRGFYPVGLTADEINTYVAAHPDQKAAIFNSLTVIRKNGDALEAIPYHVEYKRFLEPMAKDLNDAADLSDDPGFAKYLRLRAGALLNDDYYPSDIAWLDLESPKFDLILAPYETYTDDLLGVKATFGASVMIRNDAESQKLAIYQKYVPDLQESLPLTPADLPSKRGKQSPMEVVDSPYRAGDLLHGYQAVADNLPNDPRVHVEKGSKKIFWKNFLDARVNFIILPLAERLMRADQAAMANGDGYLADTLMHEISHGLGPAYSRTKSGQVDVREAIGPGYSALEESKADVVGELCFKWLVDHGAVPKENLNKTYASYVAGIFRTVRFGVAEAHGHGEIMQFNYYVEQGAITRDASTGLYAIDFEKMSGAIASLAKELLEQEATGDRARTEAWFKKYGEMPPDLAAQLAKTNDIPVDVDPQFDFHPPLY
ncbi:MAG: Zn-dependent hydrolase [Candidatus Acidiferrales bacterium]|jgi:hypothetical protein